MKLTKKISGLFGAAAAVIAVLTVGVTVIALHTGPKLVKAPKEASDSVLDLMEAVRGGDYTRAGGCLLGTPDLGVDRAPENEVGQLVWDAFTGSFSYSLKGELYATDKGLAQDVTVSFLQLDSVTTGLNDRAQELLAQRVAEAAKPQDVYDEVYGYRDEVVTAVLRQAVEEALQTRAQTATAELTLNLVYQDDRWWVEPDTALLNAISGNILY